MAALSLFMAMQLFAVPVPAGADQWAPTFDIPQGDDGVAIADSFPAVGVSTIVASLGSPTNFEGEALCSSVTTSGQCDEANIENWGGANVLLPVCTSSTQTNCVVSMSLGTSPTTLVPSTFTQMTSGPTTPANAPSGIPEGSTVGLWTNSTPSDDGATTYATQVDLQLNFMNGKVQIPTFSAAIYPYSVISGPQYRPLQAAQIQSTISGLPTIGYQGGSPECAWTSAGTCGRLEDFTAGTSASLSVRVSNVVGGWFMGRLNNPTISVTPFDSTSRTITVTAGAVTVPAFEVVVPPSQMTPALSSYFAGLASAGVSGPVGMVGIESTSKKAFNALNVLRLVAKNTSAGSVTVWNYQTASLVTGLGDSSCFSNNSQVQGIVTTNATAYQGTAPPFSGGTFSYDVGSMHFNIAGTVVAGTYDLVIRDSVARCLYGFTSAPISATVSVTSDSSGEQNVATTTVSDTDGWIHVGAHNFNFSNPTIKVKLTQRKKRSTIICVKGAVKKRVTALRPVCPAGFIIK